jgi:hypothetical protein
VGLTPHQLEVLLLLTECLSNPKIAERLSTTPKTVDHHVAAILTKLHARSRARVPLGQHRPQGRADLPESHNPIHRTSESNIGG